MGTRIHVLAKFNDTQPTVLQATTTHATNTKSIKLLLENLMTIHP